MRRAASAGQLEFALLDDQMAALRHVRGTAGSPEAMSIGQFDSRNKTAANR